MANFGHQRERQVKRDLEEDGWVVVRAAGSLGELDLVAGKNGEPTRAIEVKATARGPFAGFPPADRQKLLDVAEQAGFEPWLAWWPKRGKLEWIGPDEWP